MAILLVDQSAYGECDDCIAERKKMILNRRNCVVDNYKSEIFNINVNRIQKEEPLHRRGKRVYAVENSGHIHKQEHKYAPKILNISEEDEKCR